MGHYILRRLLVALPTLLLVALFVTGLVEFEYREADKATRREVDQIWPELGLGKNFLHYYVTWIGQAVRGDFGTSMWTGRDVLGSVGARAHVSGLAALLAVSTATLTSVGLGTISAVWRGGRRDRGARALSATGAAAPSFVLATLALYPLWVWFGWVANQGETQPPQAVLIALTAVIVGWSTGAMSVRATSTVLREALDQDHVRSARARGMPKRSVIARHVLPNVVPPLLTIMGRRLPTLLGALIVVEVVFGLSGVGAFAFEAIRVRDYPVIQGVMFLTALLVVSATLLVDIAHAWLDPRIRHA